MQAQTRPPVSESLHGMFVGLIEILEVLGEERVAGLTILRGSVRIEPSRLADSEVMARELGLTEGVIQRLTTLAVAYWNGCRAGVPRPLAGRSYSMIGPRLVALGYVAARTTAEIDRQRREVTSYTSAEGLAPSEILVDTGSVVLDGYSVEPPRSGSRIHPLAQRLRAWALVHPSGRGLMERLRGAGRPLVG